MNAAEEVSGAEGEQLYKKQTALPKEILLTHAPVVGEP